MTPNISQTDPECIASASVGGIYISLNLYESLGKIDLKANGIVKKSWIFDESNKMDRLDVALNSFHDTWARHHMKESDRCQQMTSK